MEKEFNLSDKIIELSHNLGTGESNEEFEIFKRSDVKEFIRLLKEEMHRRARIVLEGTLMSSTELTMLEKEEKSLISIIDKLAGEKLW